MPLHEDGKVCFLGGAGVGGGDAIPFCCTRECARLCARAPSDPSQPAQLDAIPHSSSSTGCCCESGSRVGESPGGVFGRSGIRKPQVARSIRVAGSILSTGYGSSEFARIGRCYYSVSLKVGI
jgi:hypothetical protein